MPGPAIAYTQQTVTTVAKQILPADPNRLSVQILNDLDASTDYVFFGADANVTAVVGASGTGTPVNVGQGLLWTDQDATPAIWAIAKSGTQTLDIQVST